MTRFSSVRSQRGLVALLLAVAILTTVATTMVIRQANGLRKAGDQIGITNLRLELVRKALVDFVVLNSRLPCPADGALDVGLPDPNTFTPTPNPPIPNVLCNKRDGTVPWAVLGLSDKETLDGWGRKISYRVYDGGLVPQVGLTVDKGASLVACDKDFTSPTPAASAAAVPPAYLCADPTLNRTDPATVLASLVRPGLALADQGVAVTQVGFILVSHGPTGLGAWLLGGGCPAPGCRMALPPAPLTNPERPNTQAPGAGVVYVKRVNSDKTVTTADPANFFDDQVVYMTIADLLSAAGRGARNW